MAQKLLRIGIVGAGFSGTSLLAALEQLVTRPVEVILFEKTGQFGTGIAYSTESPFHLLNVRASDMSALENENGNFVEWLKLHTLDNTQPVGMQFAPRYLYGKYLKELLAKLTSSTKVNIKFIATEVTDIIPLGEQLELTTSAESFLVDKVVLALGNSLPAKPVFPVSSQHYIANPWQYQAIKNIPAQDNVVLVGSGLTMIDCVLSLYHQQHQGKIIAISRHGVLPRVHSSIKTNYSFTEPFPQRLVELMKLLRVKTKENEWQAVINAFRLHIPQVWRQLSMQDKKRFLRHAMTFWNIHRHRVPERVMELLNQLQASGQLDIISGRVIEFNEGSIKFTRRGAASVMTLSAQWLINCMGPSLGLNNQPLAQALVRQGIAQWDALNLGFEVATTGALIDSGGKVSQAFYTLGSPSKGAVWESTAVPEIRKQSLALAKLLLAE